MQTTARPPTKRTQVTEGHCFVVMSPSPIVLLRTFCSIILMSGVKSRQLLQFALKYIIKKRHFMQKATLFTFASCTPQIVLHSFSFVSLSENRTLDFSHHWGNWSLHCRIRAIHVLSCCCLEVASCNDTISAPNCVSNQIS